MIVEFVGHWGAGKSTLLRGTKEVLEAREAPTRMHNARDDCRGKDGQALSGMGRWGYAMAAMTRRPTLATWWLYNARNKRQTSKMVRYCRRIRYVDQLRFQPGNIHLVDEGPMRALPGILGAATRRPELLIPNVPVPDLIVKVQASAEVTLMRLRERPNEKWVTATDREVLAMRGDYLRHLEQHVMHGRNAVEVDTTDEADASERVADLIMEQFQSLLNSTVTEREAN